MNGNNEEKPIAYKFIILDEAKVDEKEERTYYKSILKVLSNRFLEDLQHTVNKIKINPYTFSYKFNEFRTANISVFPYQVHYVVDKTNNTVVIFAELCSYRNPQLLVQNY